MDPYDFVQDLDPNLAQTYKKRHYQGSNNDKIQDPDPNRKSIGIQGDYRVFPRMLLYD